MNWDVLSPEILELIGNCEDLAEIENKLAPPLKLSGGKRLAKKEENHPVEGAMTSFMAPIDFWWLVGSCTGVEFLGAAALGFTCGVLALGLVLGISYYCYARYKERLYAQETNDFFKIKHYQASALDVLIKKCKIDLGQVVSEEKDNVKINLSKPEIDKPSKLKSIGLSMYTAGVVYATMILGISSLFEMVGLLSVSAALISPIGIGIAIAGALAAIGIALWTGYKHYQRQEIKYEVETQKSNVEESVTNKRVQLECLKNRISDRRETQVLIEENNRRHENKMKFELDALKSAVLQNQQQQSNAVKQGTNNIFSIFRSAPQLAPAERKAPEVQAQVPVNTRARSSSLS